MPEGTVMTKADLEEAEKRVEGKVSPFNSRKVTKNGKETVIPATPLKGAPVKEVLNQDGTTRKIAGMFTKPAKMGDSGTLRHFKHTPADRTGWIEMNEEMAREYEEQRILVGYDAEEGIGLLSRTPSPLPEKKT